MGLKADQINIGNDVYMDESVQITARSITIGDKVRIFSGVKIHCEGDIIIGRLATIMPGADIKCYSLTIGTHFFAGPNFRATMAQVYGPQATLRIGDRNFIGDRVYFDCGEGIEIGNDNAFSNETAIYTHGSWQSVLDGYPTTYEGVRVGSYVMIGLRSAILAGKSVGDGTVIGAGTIVDRDVPPNSLYVNRGTYIFKESIYPRPMTREAEFDHLHNVLQQFQERLTRFGLTSNLVSDPDTQEICLQIETGDVIRYQYLHTALPCDDQILLGRLESDVMQKLCDNQLPVSGHLFDFTSRQVFTSHPKSSILVEDLRNFLRRNVIRFYTDEHFQSLSPEKALQYKQKSLS